MTKEQARLLRDVLNDSVTSWNTNVTFPATIEQMIDAKIDSINRIVERFGEDVCDEDIARREKYVELRIIMEGK